MAIRKVCTDGNDNSCFLSKKREAHRKADCRYYRNNAERRRKIREDNKRRIILARIFVKEYKSSHPCVDCTEEDWRCLSFDHVRGKKKFDICNMVTGGKSILTIKEEIKKCEIRCMNCHMKRTRVMKGWYS